MVSYAGGMHAGIPVQGVDGLGPATFLSPDSGWEAPALDDAGQPLGVVRVFVGRTQDAALAWVDDAARAIQAPLSPLVGIGDAALTTGPVIITRDGNVALCVTLAGGDARPLATVLLDAILDQPAAWPKPPVPRQDQGLTFFDADNAVALTVQGGHRPLGEPNGYVELPTQVVAWDAWGRAAAIQPAVLQP